MCKFLHKKSNFSKEKLLLFLIFYIYTPDSAMQIILGSTRIVTRYVDYFSFLRRNIRFVLSRFVTFRLVSFCYFSSRLVLFCYVSFCHFSSRLVLVEMFFCVHSRGWFVHTIFSTKS